jgi:hypothetical protein
MDCWKSLGIQATADKRKIKNAYAKLLKQNHPEDNPKEYQSIREAYDQALMIAEYIRYEEDQDAGLSHNSALAPQPWEQVQPVVEQPPPPLRERDRVRSTQFERIDSVLAGFVPLLQRDDEAAIAFCQASLNEDFFQALDVRYEFEGRLLVTLLENDLFPFAFLKYLAQEFEWDIDLERVEQMAIGHFDHDVRFSGSFYAVAHRYLAQVVRNELRVELESVFPWYADEQFDEIDELLFTTDHESELTEFCKVKENQELIQSAIEFLTEHQYITNYSSFVPTETLQWLVSQEIVPTVEGAQLLSYTPQTVVFKTPFIYRPLIWFLLYIVYVFIKVYFEPHPSSNSNVNQPASSSSSSSENFDVYSFSRETINKIARSQSGVTDKNKTVRWLQRAADKGDEEAREKLAILYYKNATDARDYKLAVDMLTWAADHDSAEANFWLAAEFTQGKAVKRDAERARQLLDRAIELGSTDAMHSKGFDLIHGHGRELNQDEGVKLLQKAADQGNLNATYELAKEYLSGQILDLNYAGAFKQLERLATRNVPIGQFWLSQLYEKGLGVSKDLTRAAELLAKAKNDASWETVNTFAWQLATQSNRQLRDGDLAVELMEDLVGHSKYTKASWIDTLAAAYAEAGEFDRAIQTQQLALETLNAGNSVYQRRYFEAHLTRYQKGESL